MKLKDELNLLVSWLINTVLVGFIFLSIGAILLLLLDIVKNYFSTNEIRPTDIYFIILFITLTPLIWLALKFYRKRNPKSKITDRIE